MSSSPTTKAAKKEHKDNKENNFSTFLGSTRWKEEWATKRSETVRVDELSKLISGVVLGLEKIITRPPISQTKAELWDILKTLDPPDCLSMQVDIKNFYKKLQDNKNLKQTKYSKNAYLPIE